MRRKPSIETPLICQASMSAAASERPEIRSRPRFPSIPSRPAGGSTGTCTIFGRCRAP